MKTYDWKEEDIIAGRVVCKPPKHKPFKATGNSTKHTYKIGWIAGETDGKLNHPVCLVAMTDGMICKRMSAKEMALHLALEGYIPMKHKWVMKVMDYLKGCYDRDWSITLDRDAK